MPGSAKPKPQIVWHHFPSDHIVFGSRLSAVGSVFKGWNARPAFGLTPHSTHVNMFTCTFFRLGWQVKVAVSSGLEAGGGTYVCERVWLAPAGILLSFSV